jgi:CRISPR-associated protein Csb1
MATETAAKLTLAELQAAVRGEAAAMRFITRLQPAGGPGDKVFPPTYAGGVYAVEDRRINGEVVRCVLLDSVQSQANRLEEALQDAFLPNWRELKPDGDGPACDLPVIAVHVGKHGWITSLTAPHRIHDAILRDSNYNGARFRDSDIGQAIVGARLHNATAFYRYCPTALLFGTWDSTAGEGLDSAKIPRAVVSEVIGVNITPGIRTESRIDPLGIKAESATIYRRTDGGWALRGNDGQWIGAASENEIEKDADGNPKKFGKGKPSDINHSNIPPKMPRFESKEIRQQNLHRLSDILQSNPLTLRYDVNSGNGRLQSHVAFNGETVRIRDGAVKPGGVTMEYALHTWTLSLTQLRRLSFPVQGSTDNAQERNEAARTVIAALALYALALDNDRGYWLRSRCELIRDKPLELEFVGALNSEKYGVGKAQDVRKTLLEPAMKAAENEKLGLIWNKSVIRLSPSEQLRTLVELSDGLEPQPEDGDAEEASAGASDQD